MKKKRPLNTQPTKKCSRTFFCIKSDGIWADNHLRSCQTNLNFDVGNVGYTVTSQYGYSFIFSVYPVYGREHVLVYIHMISACFTTHCMECMARKLAIMFCQPTQLVFSVFNTQHTSRLNTISCLGTLGYTVFNTLQPA